MPPSFARIDAELIDKGGDIFKLYEYEWDSVLRLWRNPAQASSYLCGLLASQPQYWAKLAKLAVTQGTNSSTTLSIEVALLRRWVTLGTLASALVAVNVDEFEGEERTLVTAFIEELQLVPRLVAELDAIEVVAQQLVKTPTEMPEIDWTVLQWERARPRLEPVLGSEPWWSRLVNIFTTFEVMRSELQAMSLPQEAVAATAVPANVQHRAKILVMEIQTARVDLATAVGAQTPAPLPTT